jgi:hypothetical protein
VPPVAEEPLPVIKVPELVIDIAFKIVFEATEGIETVAIPLEFKVTFCDELPLILYETIASGVPTKLNVAVEFKHIGVLFVILVNDGAVWTIIFPVSDIFGEQPVELTVKLKVPIAVGVPEIVIKPPLIFKLRPGGNPVTVAPVDTPP